MTPAESYAQKRLEAIELIRAHAPARLQESLIELLRPAIALSATRAEDSQIPLGASKFGGAPDVPLHFLWPTWNEKPLGFLAQINLEEVAAFDVEQLLPQAGTLWFFVDFEDMPDGSDPDEKGRWRVAYSRPQELVRKTPAEVETDDDENESIYDFRVDSSVVEADLEFMFDISSSDSNWLNDVEDMDYDIWESVEPTLDLCKRPSPIHRLLGRHEQGEEEIKLDCMEGAGGDEDEWILLFQFEFQRFGNYTDATIPAPAYLSFSMKSQDLKARDFTNVWLSLFEL